MWLKKTELENSRWVFPFFLATFPVYYFAFAIYAKDFTALGKEILIAFVFFSLAFFAYLSKLKLSVLLVGVGSLLHAVYDVYHDILFINSGTPNWWLEFYARSTNNAHLVAKTLGVMLQPDGSKIFKWEWVYPSL